MHCSLMTMSFAKKNVTSYWFPKYYFLLFPRFVAIGNQYEVNKYF